MPWITKDYLHIKQNRALSPWVVSWSLLRKVGCLRSELGAAHWSKQALPCRICRKATQTRDDLVRPCHKTCAEDGIGQAW